MTKENVDEKRRQKEVRAKLWSEACKQLQPYAIGGAAMVASSFFNQAIQGLLFQKMDPHRSSSKSDGKSSSLVLVALGGGVASLLRTTMLNRVQDNISANLRKEVFLSLLTRRDLEWFEGSEPQRASTEEASEEESSAPEMTPGAIGQILNEDVNDIAKSMTKTVANIFRSASSMCFATYRMLALNANLFCLSAGIVPLIGTAAIVLQKSIVKFTSQQRDAAIEAAAFCDERLTHLSMVKMSNQERHEVESYEKLQDRYVQLGRKVSLVNGCFMGFVFCASSGALFLVFSAGGKAVSSGKMSSGDLTSFVTSSFMLGLGTSGLFKALGELRQGFVSAYRVYSLIGDNSDSIDRQQTEPQPQRIDAASNGDAETHSLDVGSVQSIALENVNFAYRSHPNVPILKSVSLMLERGKVVALVGKNGSGKSTIANLLVGLLKPQSGSVLVNFSSSSDKPQSVDFHSQNRLVQKQLVQVVPQTPAIFNMSILDNIRYSHPDATSDADIERVMKASNCESFVSKYGLDYIAGLNGSQLSGGERQRLGLARALLSDPAVLILDEPASALDNEGETAVSDAIREANASGRALLLITHQAKTLELADSILVLSEGQVVETGTFPELKAKKDSELLRLMPDLC